MFGLSESDYKFIVETLRVLKKDKGTIWVFGSRARGDHQEFSDLDLMVESDKDLAAVIREVRNIFDESNLPIKVDIVPVKDFAESYKESYMQDRKRLM